MNHVSDPLHLTSDTTVIVVIVMLMSYCSNLWLSYSKQNKNITVAALSQTQQLKGKFSRQKMNLKLTCVVCV